MVKKDDSNQPRKWTIDELNLIFNSKKEKQTATDISKAINRTVTSCTEYLNTNWL